MNSTLTKEQITQFKEDGFLVIHDVFFVKDLMNTRGIFINAFNEGLWKEAPRSNETIINDIFTYFPDLVHVLFNRKFITAVEDIIGKNAVWIPECSVHRNRFIHWHKDTSIQELAGEYSHQAYDSPLIQAAIYFQENDINGGGLTVLAGSHHMRDRYKKMLSNSWADKLYYKLLKYLRLSPFDKAELSDSKIDIHTKTGDLLLFDLRIDHRSSYRSLKHKLQNNNADKLAIFNTFGAKNNVTRKYFEFMKQRPESYYEYFREKPLPDVVYRKGEELGIEIWY